MIVQRRESDQFLRAMERKDQSTASVRFEVVGEGVPANPGDPRTRSVSFEFALFVVVIDATLKNAVELKPEA